MIVDDKSSKYIKVNKINFVTCIILSILMIVYLIASIFNGKMGEIVGSIGGLAVSIYGIRYSYSIIKSRS